MSALAALVPIGVFAGFLVFVWHRLAVAPRWGRRWVPWVLAVVLIALLAAVLEGFDVWGGAWSPATMRPVAWTGQAFLATCLYLFLGFLVLGVLKTLVMLARWRHDRGRAGRLRLNRVGAPLVALLAVGVTGYGAYEASHPSVTEFEVSSPELPAQFDGARVALVTDIHAGAVRSADFTRGVVDLVNAQKPDLVVIAGDLEDGYAARYGPELAPLRDLEAPLGVYATTGNHEMFRDTANWVRAFEDLGIRVLKNENVALDKDGASITLAGVHDISGGGEFAPDPEAALAGVDPAGFTLYAAHQPRQARDVAGRGVDLQLSGHTHGGQMWPLRYLVPLQQPVIDGLHDVGDVPVLTSRGIGAWGPAIRVAAPPELPVVTLRRG
ncbi:metallophosphoesterase [Phycicoccus avicenniae]|uniref:metallophosphoesterase n=1 Tax=Phycicoccus avicenniae TaxID=2828860 RepID=UPI003D2DC95D